MKFDNRDDIIQLSPQWRGERFPDGRPKVPDHILRSLAKMTLEEVWKPIYLKGYEFQFQGDFKELHPRKKLIGRAVTAVMMPTRPDLHETLFDYGHNVEGRKGNYNQWVIDSLVEDDVVVVDMYDKIFKGTYVGGNLTTAIASRTKRGGAVVWGGVRDLEQMEKVEAVQVYYRGIDPTPVRECLMVGFNTPCRIGKAICMPGDIVYGTPSGVLFIPSHLAEEVVTGAEKAHVRDIYGFELIATGQATTAQIDRPWTAEMLEKLERFVKTDPRGAPYRHLSWAQEIDEAKKAKNVSATETML
jgi:regulator of RNase E activity RraA